MPFAQTSRAVSRTTPAIPQSVTEAPVGLGVPADSNSGKILFCVRGRCAVLSSPATWPRCIISAALPPWTSASARPPFHGRPACRPTGCVRRSFPRTVKFDWFHHPQPGTRSRGRPSNSQATAHRRNECRAPRGWQWVKASRCRRGYWWMSGNGIVQRALDKQWLKEQGVPDLKTQWIELHYGGRQAPLRDIASVNLTGTA